MKTENANGASDEQIWSLALSSQKILRDSQKLTFQTDRLPLPKDLNGRYLLWLRGGVKR
jgi:hypothetical protein